VATTKSDQFFLRLDGSSFDPEDERQEIRDLYEATKHNMRALGAVKDEMGSKIVNSIVALASKLYATRYLDRITSSFGESAKAKGCPKSTLKQSFNYDTYHDMYHEDIPFKKAEIVAIRSQRQQIKTIRTTKKCLSIRDDKRYIKASGNPFTLAFGHYSLHDSMEFSTENSAHHDNDFDSECRAEAELLYFSEDSESFEDGGYR
jgi:hypothetical protein